MLYGVHLARAEFELTTLVVIGPGCRGSVFIRSCCKGVLSTRGVLYHPHTRYLFMSHSYGELCIAFVLQNRIRIRIRIFIIPINGPTIGANKLHILIIVIGGNYTYIYIYIKYINTMFLVGFRALKKN